MSNYAPVCINMDGEPAGIGATKKRINKTMIDSGVRFVNNPDGSKTTYPADDDNADIDCIIVTHSHQDHSGRISREMALHKNAKYAMSRKEFEALVIMLEDGMNINSREWESARRAGRPLPPVISNRQELDAFLHCKKRLVDGPEWFQRPEMTIGLHPANHTTGAQSVFMVLPDSRAILDTGDTSDLELLNPDKGLLAPDEHFLTQMDFLNKMRQPGSVLIMEGTNAARQEKNSRELTHRNIVREVVETKALGGITLFPGFINQRIPVLIRILTAAGIRVHVAGKAKDMAYIQVPNLPELVRTGLVILMEEDHTEATLHGAALLNGSDPCGDETPVILTGSATMDQGMAVFFGLGVLPGKPGVPNNNKVIFTGHIFEGSKAESLMKVRKGETIKLNHNRQDHIVNVRCEVKHFDLSAHAYQGEKGKGLIGIIDFYRPDNVLVHHCPSPTDYATFVRAAEAELGNGYRPKFQHLTYKKQIIL